MIKKETVDTTGAEGECFKVLENLSVVCVVADLRVCVEGVRAHLQLTDVEVIAHETLITQSGAE